MEFCMEFRMEFRMELKNVCFRYFKNKNVDFIFLNFNFQKKFLKRHFF